MQLGPCDCVHHTEDHCDPWAVVYVHVNYHLLLTSVPSESSWITRGADSAHRPKMNGLRTEWTCCRVRPSCSKSYPSGSRYTRSRWSATHWLASTELRADSMLSLMWRLADVFCSCWEMYLFRNSESNNMLRMTSLMICWICLYLRLIILPW